MIPPSVAKINASPIGRKLKAIENLTPVDTVQGSFVPDSRHDDDRVHRTSAWIETHRQGLVRRTVRRSQGFLSFEFELQADADAMRAITAARPDMILCR